MTDAVPFRRSFFITATEGPNRWRRPRYRQDAARIEQETQSPTDRRSLRRPVPRGGARPSDGLLVLVHAGYWRSDRRYVRPERGSPIESPIAPNSTISSVFRTSSFP